MRTGPPAGHAGFFHEALVYDSDDHLLDVVLPHLQAGIAAGERTMVSVPERERALLRSARGLPSEVEFLPSLTEQQPGTAVKRLFALRTQLLADGVEQVRIVSAVPHPGTGNLWDGWRRYEAAINDLMADLPAWGLCLYDRRVTPVDVLADVERTHPHLATSDASHPVLNGRYQHPEAFLRSAGPPPPDPLEAGAPAAELTEVAPASARRAVRDIAGRAQLRGEDLENLVVATSEAITNAALHGQPPVTLKVWAAPRRMVVTVSDGGQGPTDPYAGLVPRPSADDGHGGLGLWILHQLVPTAYVRDHSGFTIRLLAGTPPA